MENKIDKIVVKSTDELIDVVHKISTVQSKKILVTFIDNSDILISSINLKVLLDSADEKSATLILQIPNNVTGVRNANLAGIPVIETPNLPTEDMWNDAEIKLRARMQKSSKKNSKLPEEYQSENITSFEERINSVLNKSQQDRVERKNQGTEESSDIVIDQDIHNIAQENKQKGDLTKIDFKNSPKQISPTSDPNKRDVRINTFFKNLFKNRKNGPNGADSKKPLAPQDKKEKILKLLPKILIPLVAVLIFVAVIYYKFAPYVRVTIFIESKPVEVEKVFTGSKNINEIDFEEGLIPTKTESVTKSVSDVVDATGTAYKGEKATGSVNISYISQDCTDADTPVTLNSGHKITTQAGKSFLLVGGATITCNGDTVVVNAQAVDVGEEYNISAGNYFTIDGYGNKIFGINSSAFTGGSKESYTVLSKQDVDKKVEELTKIATEEAENSLDDIGSGWQIIENTIESEVKEGSIKTAAAIGSETNSSDISLEVVASATYYYTAGVDEGLNQLLTEAAMNQNLFENSDGLELTLTGEIQKDLQVEDDDGDISITLTASSSVEPAVNREDLIAELMGMKWDEGTEYINNLTYTSGRDPVIHFNPENFPKKLRYFPTRQGRIDVKIEKDTVEN